MKKYNETLRYLNRMSKDVKVVWFGVNPEPRINSSYLLKKQDLERFENKQIYNLDKYLKKQNNMEFEYFSRIDLMNYKYLNDFKVNSNYTYSDGDHWSNYGELYFGRKVFLSKKFNDLLNND